MVSILLDICLLDRVSILLDRVSILLVVGPNLAAQDYQSTRQAVEAQADQVRVQNTPQDLEAQDLEAQDLALAPQVSAPVTDRAPLLATDHRARTNLIPAMAQVQAQVLRQVLRQVDQMGT